MRLWVAMGLALVALGVSRIPVAQVTMEDLLVTDRAKEAVQLQSPTLQKQLKAKGLELGAPIFVRIFKANKQLELWVQGGDGKFQLFRTYPICKLSGELGPKVEKGDDQAPEGFYTVNADWMHPRSDFHLAFNIGYPNAYDLAHARTGKAIMVHGECSSSGCFAMTDEKIEEIYTMAFAALTSGKQDFFRVHVFPFRMTDTAMKQQKASPWAAFWANLKEGYDLFEKNRVPPNDFVANGRYFFEENSALCEVEKTICKAEAEGEAPAQCKSLAFAANE
jgi:murein L,D-transpeptidase YafK